MANTCNRSLLQMAIPREIWLQLLAGLDFGFFFGHLSLEYLVHILLRTECHKLGIE